MRTTPLPTGMTSPPSSVASSQERSGPGLLAGQDRPRGPVVGGQVGDGQAADEELGEVLRGQRLEERARAVDEAEADLVGVDLPVEQPVARGGYGHRLGEEVVKLDDLDALVAEQLDEVGVVALGLLDPHDVVEEQVG